jgi:2-C-methyl-D-erythritol 2,4-cyclodiphosphate synthase
MVKVGLGYDIHRLVPGRKLWLGGVLVPHRRGALGHSDGDCLVHALADAMLGAAGEGDIGQMFPDTDPRFEGLRGEDLLRRVAARVRMKGWRVVQADAVVVLEKPKLAPYVQAMKAVMAPILGVKPGDLGIKAKTQEGLGPAGRGAAVLCWAVVLLGSGLSIHKKKKKLADI